MAELEIQQLRDGMAELGFGISPDQSLALIRYLEQLEKINSHLNLTSKTLARVDWVTLHLLDSLTALKALPSSQSLRIMDVGTGGGFPGVPLACLLPHCEVTLVDTISKKVKFATEAAQNCGIKNITGVHGRAEMLARKKVFAAQYDVLISRAVTAFVQLMEWLLPLTKEGGLCIAMKGAGYKLETAGSEEKLKELGGRIENIIDIVLPQTGILRHLIIVRKTPSTDLASNLESAKGKRKREEREKNVQKAGKEQEKAKSKIERIVQQREKEKAKQRDKALRKKQRTEKSVDKEGEEDSDHDNVEKAEGAEENNVPDVVEAVSPPPISDFPASEEA